jgi:hypothetical protein
MVVADVLSNWSCPMLLADPVDVGESHIILNGTDKSSAVVKLAFSGTGVDYVRSFVVIKTCGSVDR